MRRLILKYDGIETMEAMAETVIHFLNSKRSLQICQIAEKDSDKLPKVTADIVVLSIPYKPGLLMTYWWHKVKKWITTTGFDTCYFLNGFIPTKFPSKKIWILTETAYLNKKKHLADWQTNSKKHFTESIRQTQNIYAFAPTATDALKKDYAENASIRTLLPYPDNLAFRALSWEEKNKIREQYTDGNSYFVSYLQPSDEDLLVHILKAFSLFKKWQKSHMQFVLICRSEFTPSIHEKLAAYHYRAAVVLISSITVDIAANIIGAAYATVHLPTNEAILQPLLASVFSEVPTITLRQPAFTDIVGEDAWFLEQDTEENLGQALISIYKGEALHTALGEKLGKRSAILKSKAKENADIFS